MSGNSDSELKINRLVSLAANGDDEAMSELIALVMPAAKAKAARLNSGFNRISDEDLVQEGMIGFLNAVRSFDESKGVPFKSFASVCIENRIISVLRKLSNSGNAALSTAVSIEDDNLTAQSVNPFDMVDSKQAADNLLEKAKEILSKNEMQVLSLKLEGLSYAAIAEKLGKTEKSIDGTLQRIRKKLKDFKV